VLTCQEREAIRAMPPYVFMFLCTHEGFGATFVQIHNLVEVSSKFLIMCSKCVRRVEFARAVSGGAWARGGEVASAEAELPRATRLRPNSGRISPPNSVRYFDLFFLQKPADHLSSSVSLSIHLFLKSDL